MLEALELYGDNWSEVAAHVGTKSQVACVMHFLQLPIEDQFIDTMEGTNTTAAAAAAGAAPSTAAAAAAPSSAGASTAAVADGDVAELFADAGNPVMAQVSVAGTENCRYLSGSTVFCSMVIHGLAPRCSFWS